MASSTSAEEPMNAMAPARPAELHQRRLRLVREPAAAGQARRQLRAALCAWQVAVDPDIAILLVSDVVTNVVTRRAGPSLTVAIRCTPTHLRVDAYDSARSLTLAAGDASGEMDGAPELALVALLADDWGVFRTPAGRAVYFALALDGYAAGPPLSLETVVPLQSSRITD